MRNIINKFSLFIKNPLYTYIVTLIIFIFLSVSYFYNPLKIRIDTATLFSSDKSYFIEEEVLKHLSKSI